MDSILSVQNKNVSGDGKLFTKVSRAVTEARSHFYWQFLGIWQSPWRVVLEPLHIYMSTIWDEWHCWKSGTQNKGRDRLLYCCIQAWMKNGGLILWNAVAIMPNVQDLLADGWIPHPISSRDQSRLDQFGKTFSWNIHRISCWSQVENLERRLYVFQTLKNWNRWTQRKFSLEESTQKKCWRHKGETIVHSTVAEGTAKLFGRDHGVQEPTPRREQPVRSERSQRRTSRQLGEFSTDRNKRWRWSPKSLQVNLSSSDRTSSSTLRAERRNIPYSTERHWRDQDCSHKSGCDAKKPYWRFLECRRGSKFVRFMDRIHGCGLQKSCNYRTWLFDAWNLVACQKQLRRRKSTNGLLKSRRSRTLEDGEAFISSIQKMDSTEKPSKSRRKSSRFRWRRWCFAKWEHRSAQRSCWKPQAKVMNPTKSQRQSLHASWKLMNPGGGVWNLLHQKIMKITSRRKATIRKVIAFENLPAWQLDSVTSKKDVILEAQRRAKESQLCFFDGHLSSQKKCGVRNKSTVVLRDDTVKDDSGAYAVFTEQCSSAWLPDCAGQAADAETAYTQARLEDAPK